MSIGGAAAAAAAASIRGQASPRAAPDPDPRHVSPSHRPRRSPSQPHLASAFLHPPKRRLASSSSSSSSSLHTSSRPNSVVSARLFGPSIFESSKLKVLFLGDGKDKHPEQMPRAYTLTHSDVTAKLTLAISHTINIAQFEGWYNKFQRDEVLAEWHKTQGTLSLHVHCHISGGHWFLDLLARIRFHIFRKELPVVLAAFMHGDETLFRNHPELEESLVWVYFDSHIEEFNCVECWGPLREAAIKGPPLEAANQAMASAEVVDEAGKELSGDMILGAMRKPPMRCQQACDCCSPHGNVIPLPASFKDNLYGNPYNLSVNFETATIDSMSIEPTPKGPL